ncbi:hypothetical protein QL285_022034 [Trifolium repens]|nr:hypothetical protein QL285_022034 [Trifolium repens]
MGNNRSSDFTKIELSAPNLHTITFYDTPSQRLWLQDLDNIKSLTVTACTLQILSLVPDLFKVKLPSLRNLKSLKVKLKPRPFGLSSYIEKEDVFKYMLSHKEVLKIRLKEADEPFVIIPEGIIDFLLQNSPSSEIEIIDYRSPQEIMQSVETDLQTKVLEFQYCCLSMSDGIVDLFVSNRQRSQILSKPYFAVPLHPVRSRAECLLGCVNRQFQGTSYQRFKLRSQSHQGFHDFGTS